jgi:hypothetical protein
MAFRKTPMDGAVVNFPPFDYRSPGDDRSSSQVSLNGELINAKTMHQMSTFVEQEDALLGVLTVHESVSYALRLQCVLNMSGFANLILTFQVCHCCRGERSQLESTASSPPSACNRVPTSESALPSLAEFPAVCVYYLVAPPS